MRVGLVSGDGLPVSGLLTVFRNIVQLGNDMSLLQLPIPAELGFSWRPDKPAYYPHDDANTNSPSWMTLAPSVIGGQDDSVAHAAALTTVRESLAHLAYLTTTQRHQLDVLSTQLNNQYYQHFRAWLDQNNIDWVIAVNMTLPDAAPVTAALYRAVANRYARTGSTGILFWDHDLFGSCALHDPDTGKRLYPERPNALTPLPRATPYTRWVVVSDDLAAEAADYPTDLCPEVIPNILPAIPDGALTQRHTQFIHQHRLDPRRPILLNPVRVFGVKGVHLAIRVLAAMKDHAHHRGAMMPYLLIFGGLGEDPAYARQMIALAEELHVSDDVVFLDGVPLTSNCDLTGVWRLDEIDLLRIAASNGGGIVFTPSVADVETVGLGPGLAAAAHLPCLTTPYATFDHVYGPDFWRITLASDTSEAIHAAAGCYLDALLRRQQRDPRVLNQLHSNHQALQTIFPTDEWMNMWRHLAATRHPKVPAPTTNTPT